LDCRWLANFEAQALTLTISVRLHRCNCPKLVNLLLFAFEEGPSDREVTAMDGVGRAAAFAGDLDDPWVASIASALPGPALQLQCAAELPATWPDSLRHVELVVVHRAVLSGEDIERLRALRKHLADASVAAPARVVVLTHGPHVRYSELQRVLSVVDAVIPEAIAADVVGRYACVRDDGSSTTPSVRPKVAVVSRLRELRLVLADAVTAANFTAQPVRDWDEVAASEAALWDVPVLEPGWERVLARAAGSRKVITLFGFADREIVRAAKVNGAVACLDLPCDPLDLRWVLDRAFASSAKFVDPAHAVPPPPAGLLRRAGPSIGRPADAAIE
jgi:hypothetical protein